MGLIALRRISGTERPRVTARFTTVLARCSGVGPHIGGLRKLDALLPILGDDAHHKGGGIGFQPRMGVALGVAHRVIFDGDSSTLRSQSS